jgi:predicted Holliday junction resolvase-like endonuclease
MMPCTETTCTENGTASSHERLTFPPCFFFDFTNIIVLFGAKNYKYSYDQRFGEDRILRRDELISRLQSSNLYAECTHCGEEFRLSDAILFDGLRKFPEAAEKKQEELLEALAQRSDVLKKRKISAGPGAEKKAIEVGIGKIIEKIIPAYKEFKIPLSDCRPLFEPIDLIVFNGMSKMNVGSLTFLEIKTGMSRLGKHERMVREAIEKRKVVYKVT